MRVRAAATYIVLAAAVAAAAIAGLATSEASADTSQPRYRAAVSAGANVAASAAPVSAAISRVELKANALYRASAAAARVVAIADVARPRAVFAVDAGRAMGEVSSPVIRGESSGWDVSFVEGHVIPVLGVSWVNLGADVNIEPAIVTELTDTVVSLDGLVFAVGVNLTDLVSATDSLTLTGSFTRAFADTATPTESMSLGVTKPFARIAVTSCVHGDARLNDWPLHESDQSDVVLGSDRALITTGKVISDSTTPTDALNSMVLGKVLADLQASGETISLAVGHTRSDTTTPTDSTALVASYVRVFRFNEITSVLNGGTLFYDPVLPPLAGPLHESDQSDVVLAGDRAVLSSGKVLSDTQSSSDSSGMDLTKPLSDTGAATDSATLAPTKVVSDTQSSADAMSRVVDYQRTFALREITSVLNGAQDVNDWPLHESDQSDAPIAADYKALAITSVLSDSQSSADTVTVYLDYANRVLNQHVLHVTILN